MISIIVNVLAFLQMTNFGLFQAKEFADNNFEFDENGRKISKRVENSVVKGEIAHYEHSDSVFKRLLQETHKN